MNKIKIPNGNYQAVKFCEIPFTGIYEQDYLNNQTSFIFLYHSNRFQNISIGYVNFTTSMTDVKLLEQRLDCTDNPFFYYKVNDDVIELYCMCIPNVSGTVTLLSNAENEAFKLLKSHSFVSLSDLKISSPLLNVLNTQTKNLTALNSNINNLYVNRANVNHWHDVVTFDISNFIKKQNPRGYFKIVNTVGTDTLKTLYVVEGAIFNDGSVVYLDSSSRTDNSITLSYDNTNKIITISGGTGPGAISIEYIPQYKIV